MAELVPGTEPGITLVEADSSDALLDGIEAAARNGCPPPSLALVNRFSSKRIGAKLLGHFEALRREPRFQVAANRPPSINSNHE
jgi:hypothetical protein